MGEKIRGKSPIGEESLNKFWLLIHSITVMSTKIFRMHMGFTSYLC